MRCFAVRAGALVVLVTLAACDLSVSNPDRVQDPLLNDPGAHAAVVAGASLALSEAINWVAFFGGDASKEFTQGGRIHPVKLPLDPGQLTVDGIPDNAWNSAQRARWVAEDAVRRLRNVMDTLFDSYDLGAKALLYAGYANRLLGENMCEAVFDGGPPSAYTDYFRRAEAALTEAISVAGAAADTRVSTAATAARASVRLMLGDTAGAASDAAGVSTDFVFQAVYSIENEDYYNFLYWVNATSRTAKSAFPARPTSSTTRARATRAWRGAPILSYRPRSSSTCPGSSPRNTRDGTRRSTSRPAARCGWSKPRSRCGPGTGRRP